MFVIFEGLDKSGKTTLEWEFLKATNFKYVVVDRGPAGYMVFDRLFERRTLKSDASFILDAKRMMEHDMAIIVYCKVSEDIAMKRLDEHGETCPYDYKFAQQLYDMNIRMLYDENKVVTIDTSSSIGECVERIVEKLQEVLKR